MGAECPVSIHALYWVTADEIQDIMDHTYMYLSAMYLILYISANCLGQDFLKGMRFQDQRIIKDFRNKPNQNIICSSFHYYGDYWSCHH